MSRLLKLRWLSDPTGLARRDRRSCEYHAYIPDGLVNREVSLNGDVAADITDAESDVRALNSQTGALTNTEVLARLLLRAESVASSHIEGLEIGGRRLLRSEAERALGRPSSDVTANEVLGNISAMEWAVEQIDSPNAITLKLLLEAHKLLLSGTRLEHYGGVIRTEQNWVGGSDYNPCTAAYVPPPPEHVASLLDDLCAFCRDDHLPALVQAAMAHAQFETIHPFVDGNGRIGRVLVHMLLRARNVAPRVVPPISLILATRSRDYIEGLSKTRYVGRQSSASAHDGLNDWLAFFASCTRRAVLDATTFESRIKEIQAAWRANLAPRTNSGLSHLLEVLPGAPVLTVDGASKMIGRSFPATNAVIQQLVDAKILSQVNWGKRNRAFEAVEIINAFTDLERQLASPGGNTHQSPPAREVPYRPVP